MTTSQATKQRLILTVAHQDFEKGLNSYAFFKVSNHAAGEDLVQETFLKTWAYLAKGGKIDTMKAFLYHVLNHLILDEYRKHKTVSLDALISKGLDPSIDYSERLVNMLDGKEASLLIDKLPALYQTIVRMRYMQDLSLEEMSILTHQSRNTVSVQALRGLKMLRALYVLHN